MRDTVELYAVAALCSVVWLVNHAGGSRYDACVTVA